MTGTDGASDGRTPLFSVAIACYNAQEHVEAAVRSALEQRPAPHEVVVCDDASRDESLQVLQRLGPHVRVVQHATNRGEAAAKNTAVRACTTEFVVLLDADDEFLPGRLASIVAAFADDTSLDVVTTDAYLVQAGHVLGRWYGPTNPLPRGDLRLALLRYNPVFGHAAVRVSAFEAVDGFAEDLSHAADWDLWIRMALAGATFSVIPEPLSTYRLHGGNASADRPAMHAGAVRLLTRLQQRDDLSEPERRALTDTIARESRILARDELKTHLLSGRSAAVRCSAWAVVRDPGQPLRSRALASATWPLPAAASWAWRRRSRGTWAGPGGVRLPLRSG